MNIKTYIFLHFLCFFICEAYSQSLANSQKLDYSNKGLALGSIRSLAYDESGFLWISGSSSEVFWGIYREPQALLQRFDGSEFHTIPVPSNEVELEYITQILKSDDIFYLRCDGNKGDMVMILNPLTMEFEVINFPEEGKVFSELSNIFEHNGRYLVFTKNKNSNIVLYELKKNKATKILSIDPPKDFRLNVATDFLCFENGFLLSLNFDGIYLFDWQGNLIKTPNELYDAGKSPFNNVWIDGRVKLDNVHYFMFREQPILFRYLPEEKIIVPAMDFRKKIGSREFQVWNDGKGEAWIAIQDEENIILNKLTKDGLHPQQILPSEKLSFRTQFLSEDATQNLWLGNQDFELKYYRFFPKTFHRFLTNQSIRNLYRLNKTKVLVGTEFSGFYVVDFEKNTEEPFPVFLNNKYVNPPTIRGIIPEKDSLHIWTNNHFGLLRVNLKTHQAQFWETKPVECMTRLNDQILIIGTRNNHLNAFNTKTKTSKILVKNDSLWIMGLAINEGNVYAATDQGLLVYDSKNKKPSFYQPSQNKLDNNLISITKEEGNSLLIGTRSGKVYRFYFKNNVFETVYMDNFKAPIASLVWYNEKLWINTFKGFLAWDPNSKTAQRYSTKDGFSNNEANRYSVLPIDEGLFIGTVGGLTFFDPEKLDPQRNECQLVLLSIKKFDSSKNDFIQNFNRIQLENTHRIVLPLENRSLQLNFGFPNCPLMGNMNYKYRINKGDWVSLGVTQNIRFESLEPGKHELEIAAMDFGGTVIGNSLKLEVIAKNFFYKEWWFIGLLFLITFILIFIFFNIRIKKINQEQALRSLIASNLHDEVGGLLTGISMRAEMLQMNQKGLPKEEFAEKIAKSSKEAIQVMSDTIWSIDSRNDDWNSLLLRLREFGNKLFEDSKTEFIFEIKGTIPQRITPAKRQAIYLICKESLNNSMKHAQASAVWVVCSFSSAEVRIIISDNGKGFNKKEESSGQGLKNMEMRAKQIQAKIEVFQTNGTKICLTIPSA